MKGRERGACSTFAMTWGERERIRNAGDGCTFLYKSIIHERVVPFKTNVFALVAIVMVDQKGKYNVNVGVRVAVDMVYQNRKYQDKMLEWLVLYLHCDVLVLAIQKEK